MSARNLEDLTLQEAAAAIRGGDVSAEIYVGTLIARTKELTRLGAITTPNYELCYAEAVALDQRRSAGSTLGPLAGVPFLIKDNIDVAGLPTTACTPALRNNVAGRDAAVVAKLRAADALILGKATMHEMAMGGTSNNPGSPPVLNPYDEGVIAGGSSGGAAAGLAARLCPGGLGTDTGGSVPIPAALCGVVGLRPSTGRYANGGLLVSTVTRDVIGPIARSVGDVQLIDAVITGDGDSPDAGPPRLRLGLPTRYFWDALDGEVEAVLAAALKRLKSAGFAVLETEVADVNQLAQATARGLATETSRDLRATLAALPGSPTLADLEAQAASPRIAAMLREIRDGRGSPALLHEALTVHRPRLQRAFAEALDRIDVDALLVPTTPLPARFVGDDMGVVLNGRNVDMFVYTRNTRVVSCAGLPFLTLPAGLTSAGLPVGIGLVGRQQQDRKILALGTLCERALGVLPKPEFGIE